MKLLELVTATANPHKLQEIQAILASQENLDIVLLPRPVTVTVPAEDAATLEGNARIKANGFADDTGRLAVADDTGLEVDALGGAPGVYSARFAGPQANYEDNVAALLEALADVPVQRRQACFRTIALVRAPDGAEIATEGVLEGAIGVVPQGSGGFGYDPVFIPNGYQGQTLAELPAREKNHISARGQAFRQLAKALGAAKLG